MTVTISRIELPNGQTPPPNFQVKLTYLGDQKIKIDYKFQHNDRWFELIQHAVPTQQTLVIPLKTAFVCYNKKNIDQVFEITRTLNQHGVLTWFDEDNMVPGAVSPENHIRNGLERSDHILIFLSKEAIAGNGMQKTEMEIAKEIYNTKANPNFYIVPIILDDIEVPDDFQNIQYVKKSDQRWLEKVLRTIKPPLKES